MFYTKKIAPESKLSCEKRECAGSALALSDTVVPSMTLPANAGPSSKVRSLNNTPQSGLCRGPRMQPICKKIALESKLSCDDAGSALALSDTVVPSMTPPANAGPSSKVRSLNAAHLQENRT